MKKMALRVAVVFMVAVSLCGIRGYSQEFDIMTGTWGGRLACEALLCLSSGVRPAECGPSLAFYNSIVGATPADTAALRLAFLMSCPTGGGGSDGGESAGATMTEKDKSDLANSIVYGDNGGE